MPCATTGEGGPVHLPGVCRAEIQALLSAWSRDSLVGVGWGIDSRNQSEAVVVKLPRNIHLNRPTALGVRIAPSVTAGEDGLGLHA